MASKKTETEANASLIAACPTMHGKLQDTVAWLDREIENLEQAMEVSRYLADLHFRLTELRDDLAETLRKIGGEA